MYQSELDTQNLAVLDHGCWPGNGKQVHASRVGAWRFSALESTCLFDLPNSSRGQVQSEERLPRKALMHTPSNPGSTVILNLLGRAAERHAPVFLLSYWRCVVAEAGRGVGARCCCPRAESGPAPCCPGRRSCGPLSSSLPPSVSDYC